MLLAKRRHKLWPTFWLSFSVPQCSETQRAREY